jgi:hypothetical protein
VDFRADHQVEIRAQTHGQETVMTQPINGEVWDPLASLYVLRQLPLAAGLSACMNVYGLKHIWRLTGRVLQREHLSLNLGEFDTWHLSGDAVQLDDPKQHRHMDVWISDDARRLPVVISAGLDVGGVKATLDGFRRPGERPQQAPSKLNMQW